MLVRGDSSRVWQFFFTFLPFVCIASIPNHCTARSFLWDRSSELVRGRIFHNAHRNLCWWSYRRQNLNTYSLYTYIKIFIISKYFCEKICFQYPPEFDRPSRCVLPNVAFPKNVSHRFLSNELLGQAFMFRKPSLGYFFCYCSDEVIPLLGLSQGHEYFSPIVLCMSLFDGSFFTFPPFHDPIQLREFRYPFTGKSLMSSILYSQLK